MTTVQTFVERRAPRRVVRPQVPVRRRVVRAALWAVVVLGTFAHLASLAAPLWFQAQGQRLLVVTSGSMEPRFAAGDVVVLRSVSDPSELKPGLVVTFQPVGATGLVTHRIVSLHRLPAMEDPGDGTPAVPVLDETGAPVMRAYVRTQGDANPEPDVNATPVERVRGVLLEAHRGWGTALTWAGSAQGRATMLVPPLLALATLEVMAVLAARRRAAAPPVRSDRRLDALLLD